MSAEETVWRRRVLRVTVPAVLKGQFRRSMKSETGANRHGVTVSVRPLCLGSGFVASLLDRYFATWVTRSRAHADGARGVIRSVKLRLLETRCLPDCIFSHRGYVCVYCPPVSAYVTCKQLRCSLHLFECSAGIHSAL